MASISKKKVFHPIFQCREVLRADTHEATDVEGIFRLAGSEKRIKELKVAFDSPDRYGKGLDWNGFTVHDAANILRRYFNQLPEPIIPLDSYQKFRDPLKHHQVQAVGSIDPAAQNASHGDFDPEAAISSYQRLITELPPLNRQLLLYILDLLAVFASKSDFNKMTTANLAAIFQPGILNHPQHDMAPQEYRLSQDVLIFLIENQDSFLIGMPGTGADPETVRDLENATTAVPNTPTTPNRSKTVIGRSGSNSSVAAESVRKWGSVRRNVSVSSKHSKRSDAGPTPATPTQSTPGTGVHRSNTVPSRRNGSTPQSPRFSREKGSNSPTPSAGTPAISQVPTDPTTVHQGSLQSTPVSSSAPGFPLAPPEVVSASSSEATTPLAHVESNTSSAVRDFQTPKKDTTPLLAPPSGSIEKPVDRSASNPPSASSDRKFFGILKQSPVSDGEGRKPKKLQKKRIPGSALSSAQSSAQSLPEEAKDITQQSPASPSFTSAGTMEVPSELESEEIHVAKPLPIPATPQRNPTDATLKPTVSPTHSYNSHTDDTSDADMVGDDMPAQSSDSGPREKKKSRWRFSRSNNRVDQPALSGNPLGTMNTKEQATSKSTIDSGTSQPRMSFQEPAPLTAVATDPALAAAAAPAAAPAALVPSPPQAIQPSATDPVFSDSERERKGLFSRIRERMRDGKDKDAEKRSRTLERGHDRSKSKQDLRLPDEVIPVRGKSMEQARATSNAASTAPVSQVSAPHAPAAPATLAPVTGAQSQGAGLNGEHTGSNGATTHKVPE